MVYKPLESEVKQSKFRKPDRFKLPITTCPYFPKHNDSESGNHSSLDLSATESPSSPSI